MEYFELLKSTKIFKEASEFEAQAMMFCFKTKFKYFKKGETIIKQGDSMDYIILMLKGEGIIQNVDTLGNISILMKLNKGEAYGVESAYANEDFYKDSVIAQSKCLILFLDRHRVITPCQNRCRRHEFVVKNLMKMVAEKNIELLDKLNHMSKKTIREKLLSYLYSQQHKMKSTYFEIPFNKTELSAYLSVDRSAMSSELNKMKKEGILDFDKKQYHIIKKDE